MVELNYRPLNALGLSARAAIAPKEAAVHVWEMPKRRMITLRIDPNNSDLVARASKALNMALPMKPNTFTQGEGDAVVIWTSPDEFMIDLPFGGPNGKDAKVLASLTEALADDFALVADVSDQMAGIGLGGQAWRDAWSKVGPLDVHESVFGPGQCFQSVASKINVLCYSLSANGGTVSQVRIYTRRSFAQYLFARLEDAGLEYGVSLSAL